jgi:hypothetical protein
VAASFHFISKEKVRSTRVSSFTRSAILLENERKALSANGTFLFLKAEFIDARPFYFQGFVGHRAST